MRFGFPFIVFLLLSGSLGATIEKPNDAIEEPSEDRKGTCADKRLCECTVNNVKTCCRCPPKRCFPGSSRVLLSSGDVINMADMQLGDIVMAGTDTGNPVPSKFLGWLDKKPTEVGLYLSVVTQSGHEIRLTSDHGIAVRQNGSLVSYKFAGDVLLDDELILMEDLEKTHRCETPEYSRVVSIQPVLDTGAFVPLTEHGTIFVDGVQASCYATVDHHLADVFFAPVRWFPGILEDSESQWKNGVRGYVQLLKTMSKWAGVRRPYQYVAVQNVLGHADGTWKNVLSAVESI